MALKGGYLEFMMLQNFLLVLLIISFATPILGLEPRKLDDATVPAPPTEVKCTPCNPPPSPPPPCPPPPALPPPSPPPPSPKTSSYCPPPPPAYLYITGPPGNLYPIVYEFSGAGRTSRLPVLIGCGLLGLFLRIFGL